MRRVHHELAKVSNWIMFPFLFLLILGIAVLIIVIEKPETDNNSILVQWVNESFSR